MDCIKRVYKEEGIRGFYRGLFASYLGLFESSLYFLFYENLKVQVQKYDHKKYEPSYSYSPLQYIFMASLSKLFACSLTYPHEVKSKINF
jgi:hypothetical protein